MTKVLLFTLYIFLTPFISETILDMSVFLALALTLILNDWLQSHFSIKRAIGFLGLAAASYILVIEFLSIDMLIYLAQEHAIHQNIVLLIMGFFVVLGWGLYRFERSWKFYQSKIQSMHHHPSF